MLAVVVLQYRSWQDTIACLQSLVPDVHANRARVIVVDNPAPDVDAVTPLVEWMCGDRAVPQRAPIVLPPDRPDSEWDIVSPHEPRRELAPWTLVRSQTNDGYARGMNRGIRLALTDSRVIGVWLLNNDTVVSADAARRLFDAMVQSANDIGQWGMSVRQWDTPDVLQCAGWWQWNRWLGRSTPWGGDARAEAWDAVTAPPPGPGYVYGASWALRPSALHAVGLLDESAFLFGEELDWSCRADRHWRTGLVPDSVVYHREGAAIGGRRDSPVRSAEADAHGIAARLRLSRRFFGISLPCVYLALFGAALNRLRRGQSDRARAILRMLLSRSPAPQWPPAQAAPVHPLE
jgi:GT2 family glycosyltransferase